MAIHLESVRREFRFAVPARTSRGAYNTRTVWYIVATDPELPGVAGIGEAAPLPDLSLDSMPDFGDRVADVCRRLNAGEKVDLKGLPAVTFALETALLDFENGGKHLLFDSPFARGEAGVRINGLVWIDTPEKMTEAALAKAEAGFDCIKIKIGANNFEQEMMMLDKLRMAFGPDRVELRLDANGAWHSAEEAMVKLNRLAQFDIHSLEQPCPAGMWNDTAYVCENSPIPIALDEELIRVTERSERLKMLTYLHPRYIILKPSLCGGLSGATVWMELADGLGIGYWNTSALETNVGLNAIAQWTAALDPDMPQGLGTGRLFVDNIESPLCISGQELHYQPSASWGKI